MGATPLMLGAGDDDLVFELFCLCSRAGPESPGSAFWANAPPLASDVAEMRAARDSPLETLCSDFHAFPLKISERCRAAGPTAAASASRAGVGDSPPQKENPFS